MRRSRRILNHATRTVKELAVATLDLVESARAVHNAGQYGGFRGRDLFVRTVLGIVLSVIGFGYIIVLIVNIFRALINGDFDAIFDSLRAIFITLVVMCCVGFVINLLPE